MPAYKLTLSDNTEITVSFEGPTCELQVDNDVYTFSQGPAGSAVTSKTPMEKGMGSGDTFKPQAPLVTVIGPVAVTVPSPAPTRTCINCQGRYYCISGGCANTPCGWICG